MADSIPAVALSESAHPTVDLSKSPLDADHDDFTIESDPAFPGQWRLRGDYIEGVSRMTHWEYPEAVDRFSRVVDAIGVNAELTKLGALEGDLVMIDKFDFDFYPNQGNQYIPASLLEEDEKILKEEERMRSLRLGQIAEAAGETVVVEGGEGEAGDEGGELLEDFDESDFDLGGLQEGEEFYTST
jgi:GTP-binding protein